ncbi:MAG: hypothetical protein JTT11_00140 [Candidatus Brockarchaeota archaeon]|nr:hypothetical protein [Candidatus Brockarchaeota archaeon]
MGNTFPIEVFRVSGSNYEMGSKIGSRFKEKITKFAESSMALKKLRKVADKARYAKLIECANRRFSQYMEEIKGISDGSGVAYNDLLLLNFKYENLGTGCSTVIFKGDDSIILGHNEDGERENEDKAFILVAEPLGGTPFLVYCYPGMIPGNAFSFNSRGIVMTGNAMPTPDPKVGVPRHLVDRSVIEATSIDDALERALLPERASGFSYNLVSLKEKRAVNLETTSQRHCVTRVDGAFFHTNHYVSAGLAGIRQNASESSLVRYGQGIKMVSKADVASEKRVLEILFSTANEPNSIYASGGPGNSWTLCTAVFEVSEDIRLKVHARKERNCKPLALTTAVFGG